MNGAPRLWRYSAEERASRFARWTNLPRWRWLARRRAWHRFKEGQASDVVEVPDALPAEEPQ